MMTFIESMLILGGFFMLAVIALRRLDRWHQRKAWRDANRKAREIMRRADR